jgi:hypothetical protein
MQRRLDTHSLGSPEDRLSPCGLAAASDTKCARMPRGEGRSEAGGITLGRTS